MSLQQPPASRFLLTFGANGEIVDAVTEDERARMIATTGFEEDYSFGRLSFRLPTAQEFELFARISVPREEVLFSSFGPDLSLTVRFDFSEYDLTHTATVSGEIGSRGVSGTFNPMTGEGPDEIRANAWMPPNIANDLEIFRPVLTSVRRYYADAASPLQGDVDRLIRSSIWRLAGRAACIGLAASAGVAICGATLGIGCIAASGACAAAGFACDQGLQKIGR
jgi:hypothetical protein